MAKGRSRSRQRQLDKAVHPNITSMAQQAGGTQPQARPFALLEAINAATGQLNFDPLPRDPYNDSAFGPLAPLTPDPIDPIGPNGRSDPRTWQYPVGWNLPGNGNREVPWQVLRASADGVGVIRRCIEVRKKHVRDLKWTIGPTEEAIQAAYMANPAKGKQDAEQELQTKYAADIARLKAFWQKPWRSNDLSFGQWVNAVLEDYLVLDAVTVYPQMSYGGEVLDFRLVDSTTIKILLDSYGNRPQPPHPAFQQILYGFPRGEWAASAVQDAEGNVVVENGFARSELFYYRENYRTMSPYGLSAVEQALIDSRLYLQRQKWMLAEYDDGSTPLTWLETAASADGQALSLTQARQWEKAFNARVAGNTGERLRVKVMPNGWKAVQMSTTDERYRPEYDLYLLKLLCSYFGVPITELGFTETQGLGSSGMHEAQADVSGRVGKRPDTAVLTDIINALSCEFLKMPPELAFSFADPVGANDMESAQTDQLRQQGGVITVNDIRHSQGLALLPFAEANMPFIVGGPQGIIFLEGAKAQIEQAAQQAQMQAETQQMGTAGKLHLEGKKLEDGQQARAEQRDFAREQMQSDAETQKAAVAELQAYRTWRRRNPEPKRAFTFKYITPDDGWPELEGLGPDTVWYEGYEWLEGDELLKSAMSYLEWNTRNPGRPRGPNGRFVKAGSLISALEKEGKRTAKDSPNIDAPSTVGSMDDIHDLSGRTRQMAIDLARGHAEVLAELEEVRLINGADRAVTTRRARATMERHKLAGDPELEALIQGINGRPEHLVFAIHEHATKKGLSRISEGPFDRSIHESVGPKIRPGQRTELIKPGYTLDIDGEKIRIMKAVVDTEFEDFTKAVEGDADPKAQPPAPEQPDSRWPGWLMDLLIADLVTKALLATMSAVMGGPVISAILKGWREWSKSWKPEMGDPVPRAQSWLRQESDLGERIAEAITPAIRQAHLEGAYTGQESARALLAYQREGGDIFSAGPAVEFSMDWGGWVPGHPEAAQLLLEPGGLGRLLADSNITIKQVAAHRLDEIGKILGRGLQRGASPDEIARELEAFADGPGGKHWAWMTAITETNRALSSAAVAEYRASGLKFKGWMTAFDQRVCVICDHNAFNLDRTPRIVPIDARFPSGDMHPPGHPRCRCAPIPILEWPSTMSGSFGPAEGVS